MSVVMIGAWFEAKTPDSFPVADDPSPTAPGCLRGGVDRGMRCRGLCDFCGCDGLSCGATPKPGSSPTFALAELLASTCSVASPFFVSSCVDEAEGVAIVGSFFDAADSSAECKVNERSVAAVFGSPEVSIFESLAACS